MNEIEVRGGFLVLHNPDNSETFVSEGSIDVITPSAVGSRIFAYGASVDVKEQPNEIISVLEEDDYDNPDED